MLAWRWEYHVDSLSKSLKWLFFFFLLPGIRHLLDNSRGKSIVHRSSLRTLWAGGPSSPAAAQPPVCHPHMKVSHRGTTKSCSFHRVPESIQTGKTLENEKDYERVRHYYVIGETKHWRINITHLQSVNTTDFLIVTPISGCLSCRGGEGVGNYRVL